MIRKKKLYARPRKPFETIRISEENELIKRYGLKNKREIWKTLAKINYYRRRAMVLARSEKEEQEVLFNKLKSIGLDINSTADILDLKVENLLNRRLPTIVAEKGLATTVKGARQMVVHKKILVGDKIIDSPSYIVQVSEENKISIKKKKVKAKPKVEEKNVEAVEEKKVEVKEVKQDE